jgi:hypothetical protein
MILATKSIVPENTLINGSYLGAQYFSIKTIESKKEICDIDE